MVANISKVIKDSCSKKGLDKEVMESMIDFIFLETKEQIFRFEELSVYLPGLFIFFYGKKRLQSMKKELLWTIENLNKIVHKKSYFHRFSLEELNELLKKVDKLLLRYEEYINEKRTIKEAFRKSKNNPEEHKGISTGESQKS